MTTFTAEELARSILAIFRARNVKAGEHLSSGPVHRDFLTAGGSTSDFDAGLHHAVDMGWLLVIGPAIRLTDRGFAQMNDSRSAQH
jgi:hypothetical protein